MMTDFLSNTDPNDIKNVINALAARIAELELRNTKFGDAGEAMDSLGDLFATAFISPTDGIPVDVEEEGFTGSFISGEARTPFDAAGEFNLGVVDAGVTKYGIGAGGEYANGLDFVGVHKATGSSTNTRRLRRGFQELAGSNEASYLMEYIDTNVGANLITSNPGFETGDATGWTLGASAAVSASAISGAYSARVAGDGAGGTATSIKYPCTAGDPLLCSVLAGGGFSPGISSLFQIIFYNAGSVLVSTVTIKSFSGFMTVNTFSANVVVPETATQFSVYFYFVNGGPGSITYADNFSASVVSISNKLGFHGDNGAVITEAEDSEIANVAFGTGQISKWPFILTGAASVGGSLDASAAYKYQITFADNTGGESLPNPISAAIATTGANKIITLSGLPKRAPGCVTINIYRTEGGGAIPYYLANLATDAVTYVDSAADSTLDLARSVPTYNNSIERPFYPPFAMVSGALMLSNATITMTLDAGQVTSGFWGTSAVNAADLDWFTFPIFIAKGVYSLTVISTTYLNAGKIDWYLDGGITAITAQDWYSAGTVYNVVKTGSITIPTSGYHQLLAKVNGKNASSSDYRFLCTYLNLTPTAF